MSRSLSAACCFEFLAVAQDVRLAMNTPDRAVRVSYCLTGRGWSQCRIAIGDAVLVTTASYLSDALGDFAKAVVRLTEGRDHARFAFAGEPGEYSWTLLRSGDDVRCIVHWFDDWRPHEYDDHWFDDSKPHDRRARTKPRFDATVPFVDFVHAVATMLTAVRNRYGADGYRAIWANHEFPAEALEHIHAYLKTAPA